MASPTVKDWGEKTPTEVMHLGIDFAPALDEGDTPASAVWSFITQAGLVKQNEQVQGTIAQLEMSAGTDGQTGKLRCVVTTVGGEVIEELVKLKVKARN
jgi:hypothetical protein